MVDPAGVTHDITSIADLEPQSRMRRHLLGLSPCEVDNLECNAALGGASVALCTLGIQQLAAACAEDELAAIISGGTAAGAAGIA